MAEQSADDGGKQARSPGRARRKPLKPLRGECRAFSGVTVVTNARAFYTTRAAADASGARHSLRPPLSGGQKFGQTSDAWRRENADICLSERQVKQTRSFVTRPMPRSPARRYSLETASNQWRFGLGWPKACPPHSIRRATQPRLFRAAAASRSVRALFNVPAINANQGLPSRDIFNS